ncbi:MAG: hypothetical protein AMXMBFR84_26020 [Candidatus Hydrogenedentota bacterium]
MGDLTRHWSRHEFKCKGTHCCGGAAPISLDHVRRLQLVCDDICVFLKVKPEEMRFTCSSGFRCVTHNMTVGDSSPVSQHCLGLATDIVKPAQLTMGQFYMFMDRHFGAGGLGVYPRFYMGKGLYSPNNAFIHCDSRGARSRWGYLGPDKVTVEKALDYAETSGQ